ncbi:hypothetical protein EV644_101423 [Kribbella orskensis]|uniref:Uncharacterized protein n=1 Tax=Kribbella orskensis TaxID=2512216 RepID=A0ABY2BU89_9ACTN|nr:hypothetical protein EV642_101566 [Kribbella sp. VKM Ac-2500]TCO31780.1 hypothetical protein EV644_101423 [Kribbella orskensis]
MVATNPLEFGTTTRQKVPQYPVPSSCAASSSSRGKFRKYWRNRNVANAWNNPGMIRPRKELTRPRVETSTKLGTKVTAAGISSVATMK